MLITVIPVFSDRYDTAFRCECRSWINYSSVQDVGKVLTCTCGTQWKVVSSDTDTTAVEKVTDAYPA